MYVTSNFFDFLKIGF